MAASAFQSFPEQHKGELLERCDRTTSRRFTPFGRFGADRSGAGVGLLIVRRAVAAHGGTVEIRNRPGVGCIAHVELPDADV